MRRPDPTSARTVRNLTRDFSHIGCFLFVVLLFSFAASSALAGEQTNALEPEQIQKHPALKAFDLSTKKLPRDLFFVRTSKQLTEADGVVIHGKHKDVFLVSGDPETVRGLSRRGCLVLPLDELPEAPPASNQSWSRVTEPDPAIEAMVDQVEWTGVSDKIQWLVDFGTRYSYAPNHGDVARSISDKFAGYGLETTLHSFEYDGATMWNVEATQIGTRYPDSYVVICGHFDSVSETPMKSAPGADDNGSGTAAVLTAAEILSQHSFDYSVRFICFGGEEQGLVGSYFYATMARQMNLDIVGLLNYDMMGYWEPGVEKDLEIETNGASRWLADAVVNAANLYTDAPYEVHVYDWAWWGDHFWFWMNGYSGVNHEESWDWYDADFNPYYHSTRDLLDYVHPDFTVNNIKVGVASLATLANAPASMPASFDMLPGSCPNPFNPKSNGVYSALIMGSESIDVRNINLMTLRVEGVVSPMKVRYADLASASHDSGHPCADMSGDGFDDLVMKFSTPDIAAIMGRVSKGDAVPLRLTARLYDGTVIDGEDTVVIVGNNESLATGPNDRPSADQVAETFALHQNIPNPFNPTTTIRFDVPPDGGAVTLRVFDVGGRLVRTLVDGMESPGQKSVMWNGRNENGHPVATGTYFYRLTGPGFVETRKMVILK